MIGKLILGIGGVLLITSGFRVALPFVIGAFSFWIMLGLLGEMWRMHKYRDEYIACTNAVLADSEEMADEVNRWSVNYYVHKSFRMSAGSEGIKCGYKLSVRDRPREGGGAGGDIGFISFGV